MTTEGLQATWAGGVVGGGALGFSLLEWLALRRVCWSEITS